MTNFCLIDAERIESNGGRTRPVEVRARIEGERVLVGPDALREAFGFALAPEGLCRGEVCVPVRERAALVHEGDFDLEAFAALLDRPLAIDVTEGAAVLGVSAQERARGLASLEAPDFTLPDLTGTLHSLSEHRGKKVLLIVYASW